MTAETVYIGLGANLNQPTEQLIRALSALKNLPEVQLLGYSSLYSSVPLGPQDQPEYVNAVAALHTQLTPQALLERLQRIELEQGRQRKAQRWGPRTLDLDIILFGLRTIQSEHLTIPHYHFHNREFVLHPLFELAPQLQLPDGRWLSELVASVPTNGLTKLIPAAQLQIA